ncbi:MAG TPA: AraC family transcriptional regulator [Trebonia sp.]|nr:AraC family transcriptional regulator [Trebonia sp.]
MDLLRFEAVAGGRPYHAALVPVSESAGRSLLHAHADFHEILYVVSGRGWQQTAGKRQDLRAGDLVLVRPPDAHAFGTRRDEELQFINIAFPSERWRAFASFAGVTAGASWDLAPEPVLVHDTDGLAGEAMARALAAYQDTAVALDVIALWTTVLPMLQAAEDAPGRPDWLVRACAAMYGEENLRAGLPRLLELTSVSHGHLARSMSAHYGCRPVEFVNNARLSHAAMLLATTADSVGRVAERSGFSSQSYFDRLFRARYGRTPRAYREQARRAVAPREARPALAGRPGRRGRRGAWLGSGELRSGRRGGGLRIGRRGRKSLVDGRGVAGHAEEDRVGNRAGAGRPAFPEAMRFEPPHPRVRARRRHRQHE